MNTEEKKFVELIEAFGSKVQFMATATEATENNKLKNGYIKTENEIGETVYYRFDEKYLNENYANLDRNPKYQIGDFLYVVAWWEDHGYPTYTVRIDKIKEIKRTSVSTLGIGYRTESGRFVLEEGINRRWEFDNREQAYNRACRMIGYDIEDQLYDIRKERN